MKLSIVSCFLAALTTLASAQIEIDAVFYTDDDGCDDFGEACNDLAENTCCSVSADGTQGYSSGAFFNTASGMGVTINGNFYSRQGTNDCAIVLSQVNYGICVVAPISSITGAAYNFADRKRGRRTEGSPNGVQLPDSYVFIQGDDAYYIRYSSIEKCEKLKEIRKTKDRTLLAQFMTTQYDFTKHGKKE